MYVSKPTHSRIHPSVHIAAARRRHRQPYQSWERVLPLRGPGIARTGLTWNDEAERVHPPSAPATQIRCTAHACLSLSHLPSPHAALTASSRAFSVPEDGPCGRHALQAACCILHTACCWASHVYWYITQVQLYTRVALPYRVAPYRIR